MWTRKDVIEHAMRRIGVLASDEPAQAEDYRDASSILDALTDELQAIHGIEIDPDEVSGAARMPLARLLSVELAMSYDVAPRDIREAMIGRLRAIYYPDDRKAPESSVPSDGYGEWGW